MIIALDVTYAYINIPCTPKAGMPKLPISVQE